MVIQDVRSEIDYKRFLKGIQQGQWTNWEETLQTSITWNDIWQMAPLRLSFLIRFTYDQLSFKNNLFKWKKENDPTYPLYNDKPQTLEYVLSSCETVLGNGRYTWRHNRVLEELVKFIKKSESNISTQKFVSERGRIYAGSKQTIKHPFYLPPYQDGIKITQKQYLAKVCDQTLFFCQEQTLKSSW